MHRAVCPSLHPKVRPEQLQAVQLSCQGDRRMAITYMWLPRAGGVSVAQGDIGMCNDHIVQSMICSAAPAWAELHRASALHEGGCCANRGAG